MAIASELPETTIQTPGGTQDDLVAIARAANSHPALRVEANSAARLPSRRVDLDVDDVAHCLDQGHALENAALASSGNLAYALGTRNIKVRARLS